jgi:hypothetical protein
MLVVLQILLLYFESILFYLIKYSTKGDNLQMIELFLSQFDTYHLSNFASNLMIIPLKPAILNTFIYYENFSSKFLKNHPLSYP